jgi:hypothetical protein
MEATQILAQLNTEGGPPSEWIVFPLLRQRVLIGLLGWIASALFGGLLFAFMAPIMIPHNYQIGIFPALISTLLLGVVLFVCLGSVWTVIRDILRLRNAEQCVIVITPDDFVKQEGKKTIHVPLEHIQYLTARGASSPVDRSLETARQDGQISSLRENISSLVVGRRVAESGRKGLDRMRMRTPTTLAFIDSRTKREIIVVTDKAYGDPQVIATHIKQYASQYQAKTP